MRLIIRASATPDIGAGHVMRCLNLAREWQRSGFGDARVSGVLSIPFVAQRAAQLGIGVGLDVADPDAVLVVDSYQDSVRAAGISEAARLRVLVDDLGPAPEGYDVVWNPNAYSARELYAGTTARVIAQMTPLRENLPTWRGSSRRVAVTLGGGRSAAPLVEAIAEWATRSGQEVVSTVRGAAPNGWTIVDSSHVWPAFATCSMCITTAGSTVWEAANVGIPTVAVMTADNQRLISKWLMEAGAPVYDSHTAGSGALPAWLVSAAPRATILPRVDDRAAEVARKLQELASESR